MNDLLSSEVRGPARDNSRRVWAYASLIHVAREDFGTVLGRIAEATRTGGRLHVLVREGDDEDVSTHGGAAAPRRYVETYWRESARRSVLTNAG